MRIRIVWDDNDHRILRQVLPKKWTVDDYRAIVDRTQKLIRGLKHTVHVIIDARQSTETPSMILSLARPSEKNMPSNQGEVVLIGGDEFMHIALKAARKIAPRLMGKTVTVDTLQAAHAYILKQDGSISVDDLVEA